MSMSVYNQGVIPAFTKKHTSHDDIWLLQNSNLDVLCFACAVETLEDETSLNIRKRKMVSEILDLLTTNRSIWEIFAKNRMTLRHTGNILLKLLSTKDAQLSSLLIETLGALVQRVRDENAANLLDLLVSAIRDVKNKKAEKLDPYVCLLGKIVRSSQANVKNLVINHQWVLETIAENVDKVGENAAVSYWYVFTQIYRNEFQSNVSTVISKLLLEKIVYVVGASTSKELQLNILAVLKSFVTKNCLRDLIIEQEDQDVLMSRKSIADVMKKLILSTNKDIQIGAVQCLAELLTNLETKESEKLLSFSGVLIEKGLCEFLFELLTSSEQLLVASSCNCLLRFASCQKFFTAGHIIYGFQPIMEALLRFVEKRDKFLILPGLELLLKILAESKSLSGSVLKQTKGILGILVSLSDKHEANILNFAILCSKELIIKFPKDLLDMKAIELLLENYGKAVMKKAKNESAKSSADPTVMNLLLNTLNFARCISKLLNDPSKHQLTTHSEDDDDQDLLDLGSLVQHLNIVSDLYLIPATMILMPCIKDTGIFVGFFDLLSFLLTNIDGAAFAMKLCQTSFIRIASEIKFRLTKEENADSYITYVDQFLINLASQVDDACDIMSLRGVLTKTLPFLKAPPSEWHLYFGKSSAKVDPSIISPVRAACFSLLYISARFGDPIWKDETIIACISNWVAADYCFEDDVTKRNMIYLWSYARCNNQAENVYETETMLLSMLERVQEPRNFFVNDKCLIQWIMSKATNVKVKQWILSELFSSFIVNKNNMATIEDIVGILLPFSGSLDFYVTSANIVAYEINGILEQTLKVLNQLIGRSSALDFVLPVKQVINKMVLSNGRELNHLNVAALFQVYGYLFSKETNGICDVDLKFSSRACNFFVDNPYPQVRIAILNFLNQFLSRIQKSGNPLHATVMSNAHFIKEVASFLPRTFSFAGEAIEMVSAASLVLVSQLAAVVSSQNLETVSIIPIDFNKEILLFGLVNAESNLMRFACLNFWNAFLSMKQKQTSIMQCNGLPMYLNDEELRTVLIYFQNLLLHEDQLIQEMALKGISSVLQLLRETFPHFQSPWNMFLLDNFRENIANTSKLEFCLKVLLRFLEFETPVQNMNAFVSSIHQRVKTSPQESQEAAVYLMKIVFFLIDQSLFSNEHVAVINSYLHGLEDWAMGLGTDKPTLVKQKHVTTLMKSGILFPWDDEHQQPLEMYLQEIAQYREKINNT